MDDFGVPPWIGNLHLKRMGYPIFRQIHLVPRVQTHILAGKTPSFFFVIWLFLLVSEQLVRSGTLVHDIPSGKQPHNYGKSPFLMGKHTISMAIFNSFCMFTRGYDKKWMTLPPP